ncbi:hypothetical protein QJS66_01765 [Kocuria rhizophila]|nr:hypothetical protein QJS66_01765 [Kocuria rhizophila]
MTSAANIESVLAGDDAGRWLRHHWPAAQRAPSAARAPRAASGNLTLTTAPEAVRGRRSRSRGGHRCGRHLQRGRPASMAALTGTEAGHGLANHGFSYTSRDELGAHLRAGGGVREDYARELVHVDNLVNPRPRLPARSSREHPG